METACFVVVSATTVGYLRVAGSFAGLEVGTHYPRADSVIARMLDGAPAAASGVGPGHPAADTAEHRLLGVRSYLATPVLRPDGRLLGVLVSLDHGEVPVTTEDRAQVRGIADELAASGRIPAPAGSTFEAAPGPGPGPSDADAADRSEPAEVAQVGEPAGPGVPTRVSLPAEIPPTAGTPMPAVPATDLPAAGGPVSGVPAASAAHPRPGRIPTPQTIARAVRPGGPARTTPPRPGQQAPAASGPAGPGGGTTSGP
ncbi:GAF domain-containing protein, partial [Frankia sp. R82]|uniref:GAF domain-containing protein n=1 Tax=Frankia sp. R82 TaxID=2950553 RepID=UPI0035ABFB3D|nr:hypothetical protein [Frankia sp. R82]